MRIRPHTPIRPVHYKYKVNLDPHDPAAQPYTLTVKYQTEHGVSLSEDHMEPHRPQEAFRTQPFTGGFPGYHCYNAKVVAGKDHSDTVIPVKGEPDSSTFIWDSKMPNQDVTVVYKYKGNTDTQSQHRITQRYVDTEAADQNLQDLIPLEDRCKVNDAVCSIRLPHCLQK